MHLPPKARSWIVIGLAVGPFLVLSMGPNSLRAAVTREEVERAIRDGVRYLKHEQRATAPGPTCKASPNRHDQPGDPGPADGRREARLADRPQGPRLPPQIRAG